MEDFNVTNDRGNGNFDIKPCKQTGHAYHQREDDLRHCAQCGGAEASMPTMCPGRMMTELEQHDVQHGTLDFSRGPGIKPQWWVTKDRMDEELAYHRAQDGLLEKAQKEAKALREELEEVKRPLDQQMARLNQRLIEANQEILDLKRSLP